MQHMANLGGGSPVIKRYKMAAGTAVGAVVLRAAANATGVSASTTTSVADAVGVIVDQGLTLAAGGSIAYSTTQGDAEAVFGIIVNPDAIWRLLMSGGATAGTAMTRRAVTTASSTGLVVTTGFDYSTTTMDEGTVWCIDGANVGQSRKITSVSTTAATVIMPFLNDTVVGDGFLHCPYFVGNSPAVQFTSNLLEADISIAVGTGAAMSVIDLELNGTADSYVNAVIADHVFNGSTT